MPQLHLSNASPPDAAAVQRLREARRIHLCGPPGAGKSVLARRLPERLGLPLIHLDREFWGPKLDADAAARVVRENRSAGPAR